ncbi:MAG: outer membrane beta-barrel protein [Parvularculaceae bacterium]|nr:outer membrane beta-barrel protein [Parvularculaceae bacterium]
MRIIAAAAFASAAAFSTAAEAGESCVTTSQGETVCGRPSSASGSVYSKFGATAFVRGGYAVFGKNSRTPNSAGMPMFGAGMRFHLWPGSRFSVESEFLTFKDSETAVVGLGNATLSTRGVVGLMSVRWQYDEIGWGFSPFVSAGFGPGWYKAKFDDGTTRIADSEMGLAYSGRAGVERNLLDRVTFEAAYRYLNATADAAVGQHSAELGVNYRF